MDAGAAYLGARHTELHALLDELGLKTTPTTMLGASRFALRDEVDARAGRFPPLNAVALGDLFDRLEELTSAIRADAPWLTPDASTLDNTTAAQWAEANLTHPDATLFFPLFLGEMMAADPRDISVLHMAFYLCSGGGTGYLNAFEGGAQADRVDGGAHQIAEALAAELGDRIRLAQPVRAIHQHASGVTVHTPDSTVDADVLVGALPPRLADAIDVTPGLAVRRASPRTSPGCAVKVHLVYPTPLWRDHGRSGWSVSARGPLLSTVDDSPADAPGVLTGFVTGAEAGQGQRPIAVVQPQADATEWSAEAILERANKELARTGLSSLAALVITDEFPLGPTGKVLKRELRTRHADLLTRQLAGQGA